MKVRNIEFDHLTVEVAAPGYGGAFLDSAGNLAVWSTGVSNPETVRDAVRGLGNQRVPLLGDAGSERKIVVKAADFSFSELLQWKNALFASIGPEHGVRVVDADEEHNRLRVSVSNWDRQGLVRRLASDLGIPQSALRFTIMPQSLHSTARTPLYGWASPKLAGMQISYVEQFVEHYCSEGFTVSRNGVNYFLTAAHCTGVLSGGGSRLFYQPSQGSPIGSVYENAPWSTTGCAPQANYCSTVDAAMISFQPGISSQKTVVETEIVGTNGNPGNLYIGNIYWIVTEYDGFVGQTVYKTGRTTGTTAGPITGTCVDLAAFDNHSMTCQNEVNLADEGGDSGGPVYIWMSPLLPQNRVAAGISHTTVLGQPVMYYSTMSAIHSVYPNISVY